MRQMWNGMDVDIWAPVQTMNPTPETDAVDRYSGYESIACSWADLVPEIPLSVRYANFCKRLASFKARVAV